jgi:hypothetical protein
LVESDYDHVKASAFNMVFMVWRRRTMAEAYRRAFHLVRELATEHPEGIGVCQVVEVDAIPPDSEARKAFADFMKLKALKHYSVTHDGVGFKAAAVRTIVMGVNNLARPVCKHAVFSNLTEACGWHALEQMGLGRHETPDQIGEIVRAMRSFHRERYPPNP